MLARSEAELAGAREYIASLESTLERKEAELVTACARVDELEAGRGRGRRAGRVLRAAGAALRRRVR